ncbi:hypothetical protein [Sphingomonas aracearum]|uniref:hypothetical protein n=1 Tax=Sphingomonas aracearum TaxID=2283317 RepID=UPI0011C05A1B|nr:hypothetical protein [Sphingomonas aracearum]
MSDRTAWEEAAAALRREQERDAVINARYKQAEADGTLTDQLGEEWSDSIGPVGQAEWALFAIPAPDLAALEWKLTLLRNSGMLDDDGQAERVIADVRLLAGEA